MKTIDKVPSFSYSFLGWYTICSTKDLNPLPEHLEFHKLVISSTSLENPYFLILSTNESYYESQGNYLYSNLPIELYETSLTTLNGPEINFVRRSFELTSNEMERITINFLSCNADTIESPEESSLRPRKCAKAIYYKIKLLLEYLQDVKEGILKKDSSLLREITTICDLLSNDEQLKQEHFEYDVTALLSGLTKGYLLLRKGETCVNNCFQAAQMTASATLPTVDKRLIGLYLLGVDASRGLLGSITTVAVRLPA
ncbi:uncharacterized protein LOC135120843 [Zophobas morio]|uniref:uncharacterized protein LOC135120843 n=1 Tax=Zophobas morio TaxID=2755281 RepID=UPI003083DD71